MWCCCPSHILGEHITFNNLALKPVFFFGRDTLQDWQLWTTPYACLVRFLWQLRVETFLIFWWAIGDSSMVDMLRPLFLINESLLFYCMTWVSGILHPLICRFLFTPLMYLTTFLGTYKCIKVVVSLNLISSGCIYGCVLIDSTRVVKHKDDWLGLID